MKPFKIINIFGKYYSEAYKKHVVIANVLNGDGNKILSIHFFFESDFCARRLKVGDEVLYGKYSGTEINVDTKIYLMMRQSDILAVVK